MDDTGLGLVLSEFARTMTTDFPIQGILDHLVKRIVDVLPISSAGVTLISAGAAPHYIAASDAAALRFERLQTEVGEGPCLLAYRSGDAVTAPDLVFDPRFPVFGPSAVLGGLAAVFAFPLRHAQGRLGALDLYRDSAGELNDLDMVSAQTLADVTTSYLLNAQARDEARATSDRFRYGALHDTLTGLPNRALLHERLEHAAQRAARSHTTAGVLFVDLDRFKRVNDAHGHATGDELLLAVAQRLAKLVRPGDTLARYSGDEFVFLCEDLRTPEDVEVLANRVDEAFRAPYFVGGLAIVITASVGLAYGGPGERIDEHLLVNADTAMYQAKRKGGAAHQVIDLRSAVLDNDRATLQRDLLLAFDADKLDVNYQPIVRSPDRSLIGVEALLRWTDPERGAVSPLAMVSAAEDSGLIVAIGARVLERSCRDRAHWLAAGWPLDLAVNVSARQLMSPLFPSTVADVLTRTDMDPHALVLEVTENVFIDDLDHVTAVLSSLKSLGIRVAIDDFGTGYSSLSYLRSLPVDLVKIDQIFIADVCRSAAGRTIVAAVNDLAHALGFAVVAEGVETKEQDAAVMEIGCEFAQGFLYSRPVSADVILERIVALPALA